jgi:hypothetical protein
MELSTSAQLAALQGDELDVGLLRERPPGPKFDVVRVVRGKLGVLLAAGRAESRRAAHLGGVASHLASPRSRAPRRRTGARRSRVSVASAKPLVSGTKAAPMAVISQTRR